MLIFAIDDEQAMLEMLHEAILQAEPTAEVRDFRRATAALAAVQAGERPDVVFSDIQMPGMDGLSLAARLKDLLPEVKLIFVTGYEQYAVEAYRRHVSGYVMKPAEPDKLRVRCFGYFDVFWHEEPLIFSRTQTKELFAYLIDREGAACTAGEIISALWEDNEATRNTKAYLRVLTQDLKNTLSTNGMADVLIREHGQWAVRTEKLDCDYYRMKKGEPDAINAYNGEYMMQFSWAEMTLAKLQFGEI